MPHGPHRARRALAHLGLALALLTTGCTGGSDLPVAPSVATTDGRVFNIVIEGAGDELGVGDTLALIAVGQDEQDNPIDITASWESSDPAIASISADGVVSAIATGHVTIRATLASPPREASYDLTIVEAGAAPPPFPDPDDTPEPDLPAPNDLTIYPRSPRVLVGQRLGMVAYDGDTADSVRVTATWRSLDPAVATVDEAGTVSGKTAGTARIEATSTADPTQKSVVSVTVSAPVPAAEVKGIRIKPERVTMNVGETFWLLAEVPTWQGDYDPNVRWSVADPRIASVSETGQITALAPGMTTVTATAASYDRTTLSATIPVEVRNGTVVR